MANANDRTCTIYALYASNDPSVRYVGQTTMSVHRRVGHHVSRAISQSSKPTHREAWIRKVVRDGYTVEYKVLQEGAAWNVDEIRWIKWFTDQGADLVNATAGGEGMIDAPIELRARISDRVRALWADPAYRKSQSRRMRKPWSADRRAACDAASPEVRSDRARRGRARLSPVLRSRLASNAATKGIAKKRANGTLYGVNTSGAKLTDAQVVEIKIRLSHGESHSSIANDFPVSRGSISMISRGERWPHIKLAGL